MEQLLNRIADALDKVEAIQNTNQANTQQYKQLRQELATDIKKALNERPVIQNSFDADKLAKQLLPALTAGLPNTGQLQTAGAEIVNQIRAERERIPTKIAIQGDFYGFTGWKPLALYSSLLILCGVFCTYFWYQKQETTQFQQAMELLKERNHLNTQIERYVAKNPKDGTKYFPGYNDNGFWEKFNRTVTMPESSLNPPNAHK